MMTENSLVPHDQVTSSGVITSSPTPEPSPVIIDVNGTTKKEASLQVHYNELIRVITDLGRDVKPAYTGSKSSTDKLRKNIMMARTILRECQTDLERLAAINGSPP